MSRLQIELGDTSLFSKEFTQAMPLETLLSSACYFIVFLSSTIRKGKYSPATTHTAAAAVSRSGYTPCILKWAELESFGQIAYS